MNTTTKPIAANLTGQELSRLCAELRGWRKHPDSGWIHPETSDRGAESLSVLDIPKIATDPAAALELLCWWSGNPGAEIDWGNPRQHEMGMVTVWGARKSNWVHIDHDGTPAGIARAICEAVLIAEGRAQ